MKRWLVITTSILCFVLFLILALLIFGKYQISKGVLLNGQYITNDLEPLIDTFKSEHKVFEDDLLDSIAVDYYITKNGQKTIENLELIQYLKKEDIKVEMGYTINKEVVENYVNNWNNTHPVSQDAYIYKGEDKFYIQNEVYGEQIQYDYLESDLGVEFTEPINLSDYYIQPNIKKEDLVEKCELLNNYVNWHISYDNGKALFCPLDFIDFDENYNPIINDIFLEIGLTTITNSYENKINLKEEITFVNNCFQSLESVENRTPIY